MKIVARRKDPSAHRSGAVVKSTRRQRVLFPQASFLTPNDRLAINALKMFLGTKFPNQVERVILYGSKARGDGDSESDIDLLIVTRLSEQMPQEDKLVRENKTFTQGVLDSMSKFGVNLAPLVNEAAMLDKWTPLYDHIQKEGVELWHSKQATPLQWGWTMGSDLQKDRAEHVEMRIGLAQEKLKVAQNLFDGGYYNDTVSTAYYAMFYASKAILLALGEDPHKHKGVVSLFGNRIVRVGLSDAKYGRVLSQAKALREEADYQDFFRASNEQAQESIRLAEDFVQEAKQILVRIEQSGKKEG